MPGLSVALAETVGRSDDFDDDVAAALAETEFFDHYHTATELRTDDAVVTRTSYDGYPIRRVETDHGTAFLEGRLYDVESGDAASVADGSGLAEERAPIDSSGPGDSSDAASDRGATDRGVDGHLEQVAALIAANDLDGLREWISARDGDFLVALVHDDGVAICTDPFARLPAYAATIDGTVVCSRELAFVRAFARERDDSLALDRVAIGGFLTFGYFLGTDTPFEGVQALPPGSLVRLQPDDQPPDDQHLGDQRPGDQPPAASGPGQPSDGPTGVEIDSIYEHDFETCAHADRSVATNAEELTERIEAACRRRVTPGQPTVVSLSGGLDSRLVAAAYAKVGRDDGVTGGERAVGDALPASAATFQRRGSGPDDEVAAAGAVADCLDLDWTVTAIESSPARRQTLLDTKQGMNFLGMGYVLDFFEQLQDRRGTVTCVTGDGGDKTLVGLEPATRPRSDAALVDHAIEANSRLPLATAAAIANVDPDAIRASVAERIRSYPESDPSRRYVHFLVRERGINFLGQGEDRNRYYAWSVSPFYALDVFEYAMNCPDEQKAYRDLLGRILERFEPALLDVSYPNYGAPITSSRYRAKQFVYDALERYPSVRDRIVDLMSGDGRSATDGYVLDAIRSDLPAIEQTGLSRAAAADVVERPDGYSTIERDCIATVTGLASERSAGSPDEEPTDAVDATDAAGTTSTRDQIPTSDDPASHRSQHASTDR